MIAFGSKLELAKKAAMSEVQERSGTAPKTVYVCDASSNRRLASLGKGCSRASVSALRQLTASALAPSATSPPPCNRSEVAVETCSAS